jgi:hypothetical protein
LYDRFLVNLSLLSFIYEIFQPHHLPFAALAAMIALEGRVLTFLSRRMLSKTNESKMAAPTRPGAQMPPGFPFPMPPPPPGDSGAGGGKKPCRACTDFKTWMAMQGKSVKVSN